MATESKYSNPTLDASWTSTATTPSQSEVASPNDPATAAFFATAAALAWAQSAFPQTGVGPTPDPKRQKTTDQWQVFVPTDLGRAVESTVSSPISLPAPSTTSVPSQVGSTLTRSGMKSGPLVPTTPSALIPTVLIPTVLNPPMSNPPVSNPPVSNPRAIPAQQDTTTSREPDMSEFSDDETKYIFRGVYDGIDKSAFYPFPLDVFWKKAFLFMRRRCVASQGECMQLQGQITQVNVNLREIEDKGRRLQTERATQDGRIKRLETELNGKHVQNEQNVKKYDVLEQKWNDLRAKAEAMKGIIEMMANSVESAREQEKQLESAIQSKTLELVEMRKRMTRAENKASREEKRLRKNHEQLEVLRKQIYTLEQAKRSSETVEALERKISELERRLTHAQEKTIQAKEKAEEKANQAKQIATESEERVSQAKQKVSEAQEKTNQVQQKANQAQQKANEAKERANQAESKVEEAKQKAIEAEQRAKEQSKIVKDLESALKKSEANARDDREKLRETVNQLLSDLDQAKELMVVAQSGERAATDREREEKTRVKLAHHKIDELTTKLTAESDRHSTILAEQEDRMIQERNQMLEQQQKRMIEERNQVLEQQQKRMIERRTQSLDQQQNQIENQDEKWRRELGQADPRQFKRKGSKHFRSESFRNVRQQNDTIRQNRQVVELESRLAATASELSRQKQSTQERWRSIQAECQAHFAYAQRMEHEVAYWRQYIQNIPPAPVQVAWFVPQNTPFVQDESTVDDENATYQQSQPPASM